MKTALLLVPAALLLIGANPPNPDARHRHGPESELSSVVAADRPAPPPPRAVVPPPPPRRVAPPPQAARAYPPCSATVTDRCIQSEGRRYAQTPTYRVHRTRRVHLAYRQAGERG